MVKRSVVTGQHILHSTLPEQRLPDQSELNQILHCIPKNLNSSDSIPHFSSSR